jgi:hypothetical protein
MSGTSDRSPATTKPSAKIDAATVAVGATAGIAGAAQAGVVAGAAANAVGFGTAGIQAGSIAAGMMGPSTAAGSLVASMQAVGATGSLAYLGAGATIAVVGTVGIVAAVTAMGATALAKKVIGASGNGENDPAVARAAATTCPACDAPYPNASSKICSKCGRKRD